MDKFIYVFDLDCKERLEKLGYKFLQETNNAYIFENKPNEQFSLFDNSKYMICNTLFF